jgi:PAS domain S-box-containing protein
MRESMPRSEPPAVLRYGAAIAAVAAAVAVGTLLQPALAPVVSLLLCGVLFAAWFGGLGPGLLAIALGVLAFDYFFLPPLNSLAVQSHNDVVRLISFAITALFIVVLSAKQRSTAQSLRRAHADLQAAVRDLERANASLRDENAERQRAEAALRESEKNLQTIIDTIPAHVARYRADGTPDLVNRTLREFLGPDAAIDQMRGTVHPDDIRQNWRDWRARIAAGEPHENEIRLRRADGVYRWHRIRRVPLRDANGTIVNWYGAGHDIDDQKRAETALRESEKSLQTIVDTIPAYVVRYRADGTPDFVNQTLREFVGPGVGGMRSAVHPDDLPQNLRDWHAHVAAGEPYENEMRMRRADGEYRWLYIRRVPLRDANGAIVNWYGAGHDIDDQKRAETALRENEKNLQTIIDTIPAAVMRYRADGTSDFMNHTYREFIGPSVVLDGTNSTVHPEDYPQRLRDWRAHVAAGEPYENEMRLRRADGVYRWYRVRRVPLRDANGAIVNWYGVGLDIDDQKRAETALRESEKSLQTIIDTIPAYVVRFAADGTPEFMNQTYRKFIGVEPEFIGVEFEGARSSVHPEDLPGHLSFWYAHVQTGEPYESEIRVRRADGVYRWQCVRCVPLRDANGTIVNWYGVGHDIDDQKRAEQALRRSEAHLAEAQRLSHTGSAVYNETEILYWSEGSSRIWGFDPQQGIPSREAVWQRIHPDDLDRVNKNIERAVREKTSFASEFRIILPDGTVKHVEATNHPVFSPSGELLEIFATGLDVTERKRAEQTLRESEAELIEAKRELQAMIDTIPAMVASYDANGSLTYVNKTALDYTGFPEVEGFADRQRMLIHPDDFDQIGSPWRACVAKGEPFQTELRLRRRDGEYRWISTRRVPLRDSSGKISKWYSATFDIDDRKRAEDALKKNEAELIEAKRELQQTIDIIPFQVARYSSDLKREFVNVAWKQFTGTSEEAALGTGWPSAVHPDDIVAGEQAWRDTVATGEPVHAELRLLRWDGQYRWFSVYRVALRDENGKVKKWYSTGYDIEDRKCAELALRERETQLIEARRELQLTLDLIPAQTWQTRSDGFTQYVNKTWMDYTGLPIEQARGWEWQAAVHPEDLPGLLERWRKIRESGDPEAIEARFRRHDGEYRWFLVRPAPLRDDVGNILRWYGTNTDIEDRKRAENALRRNEAYLTEAQRLSMTGSFGWRLFSDVIVWSNEMYSIFDVDPATNPTLELVFARTHPEDVERVRQYVARMAQEDQNLDAEHRLLLPNGVVKHVHVRAHRVQFGSREIEIVGAVRDVTAARNAEDALRNAQAELAHATRVTTLGELSASIAHEVDQPLTSIVASGNAAVRWLDREAPEKQRAIRSITRMVSEARRASQVILRIRELAKKAETVMSQVDMNGLVADVLMLINREATSQRVEVRPELASELPPALGDRVELQQVLINLVMNGMQAMAPVTDRARVLVIRTQRHDANQIVVAVEDTGIGIESENLDRLFGAFYTTKPDGMGMGLSISRSIVEAHGGSIWATRNSGPGMTFQFTLSVYREPAAASLVS